MVEMKNKCSECGEEFIYADMRNVPTTCGSRICTTNSKYRSRHKDPLTGDVPTPEEVKKL